jgi:malate synthase
MLETKERQLESPIGMQISGEIRETYHEVLSNEALDFLVALHEHFNETRLQLLSRREKLQKAFDEGTVPDFLPETKGIRDSSWTVASVPKDIQDRRVEITGPVDRKMVINALNSGAKVFMADFEDSNSPTWSNVVEGQINLRDAVNKTIEFVNENGKKYTLNSETAVLFVRPRGLHLPEKNIKIHGSLASGALVDFGLYFFHNAHELLRRGSAPYFYLPKLESYLEARLWNDIFKFSQSYLGIPSGTIKATVLVETMPAVFQLNEILFELKEHSAGLNCGRWDYIFSFIKKFSKNPKRILPNRDQVNMTVPFMKAYTDLVIHTCHKRNIHAMGGMAAQIPIKNDPEANNAAIDKVRQDKLREVEDGHDGT